MESFFSILISTKNRKDDLFYTLNSIFSKIKSNNYEVVVFDDGSTDGTSEMITEHFPKVILQKNKKSRSYIYCRNKMLNESKADFAISLDDDANFLTENLFEIIESFFNQNPKCGLIAARIYWDKKEPTDKSCLEKNIKVKSFIGCGHVWRMKAWQEIPNYPEWFEFYGEESFASFQLFKRQWDIHYVPDLLIHHRVDLKQRAKLKAEFANRYRRAIRADWYNYFLFFPLNKIPRKIGYSLWMQVKGKIFKGNFNVIFPLSLSIFDLILSIPRLYKYRNTLTSEQYKTYKKLNDAKIYWKKENENI
jgi:glycosyltransferase involved in cell wall biosynthesis